MRLLGPLPRLRWCTAALLALLLVVHSIARAPTSPSPPPTGRVLVVGSVNMDITIEVARLPLKGETIISPAPSVSLAVGGKGANQAVAAARLGSPATFVCRWGNDSHAAALESALAAAGVDVSGCVRVRGAGSGQGIVMLEPDGAASSIVVGGANQAWPEGEPLGAHLLHGVGVVLLQREVPEHVNQAVAKAAAAAGVPVLLDAGGEARPLSDALLPHLTFLCPNELELQSLTGGAPTDSLGQVTAAAKTLVARGAQHVLVTLAERGALLVSANGSVLHQAPLPVPGGAVVDGTAAGDAFRAALAVGLTQGWPLQHCMQFAAAAGALAVSRRGALPSLPTLQEVIQHMQAHEADVAPVLLSAAVARLESSSQSATGADEEACSAGSSSSSASCSAGRDGQAAPAFPTASAACPFEFASRLNSMAAASASGGGVLEWIQRQGQVRGLTLLDLNYPQHFHGVTDTQILAAAKAAGLRIAALNIRFPATFAAGAFTNPDPDLRGAAVQLAVDGCRKGADLRTSDLVVWSPFDGYDFTMQVDYEAAWRNTVESYSTLAAACPPGVRVSLEFKPTDAATRFSIVPNTAAALLLLRDVNAPNLGLTLDLGHLLLAGENPGQSVAAVAAAGRLWGLHLNDAHVRLGAEDGLPFGSVNPRAALEVVLQLQRFKWAGHLYFDTFVGQALDPVAEAEWNVRSFRALWRQASRLGPRLAALGAQHNGLGVLELLLQQDEDGDGGGDEEAGQEL